jgi:pyruvate,orthophosphate dikinase
MAVAQGILTSTGGRTSHAAVVARGMGTPCVCGCADVTFKDANTIVVKGKSYKKGDFLTIDGATGKVYEGQVAVKPATISGDLETFLGWADEVRAKSTRTTPSGQKVKGFDVYANGDTPKNAEDAFRFGAMGIGLCRTEHMFFDEPKLTAFQKMIVSEDTEARKENLAKILPYQQKDFYEIIKTMAGRPVTIRLLDPPLNEFIQAESKDQLKALAEKLDIKPAVLANKVAALDEHNPMLGHRGCRLAITYPEIYEMQVEAIARATAQLDKEGVAHEVQIMIPNVVSYREVEQIRGQAEAVIAKVNEECGTKLKFAIGSMVEFPRTALIADKVAQFADFFSFGTNDLSQTTFGFSRDDYGKFIESYLDQRILEDDPFATLDPDGPGALMEIAEAKGRSVKKNLHLGICGEHGGDPASIALCYKLGLNYVSCSPFRVPLARLAGAQAVIKSKN